MRRHTCRRGFLLFDLLIALTLMVMMAALVLPGLKDDSDIRLGAAAQILTSDVELAQIMTIASPENAVVVRFASDGGSYWLAYQSDPETPLDQPGDGVPPYLVEFGRGRGHYADGVSVSSTLAGNTLTFNEMGMLDLVAAPTIELSRGAMWVRLEISPQTGSITQTSGEG